MMQVLFTITNAHGKMAGKESMAKGTKRKLLWTNDMIEDLIDQVETRESIWNVKAKEYSDKDRRKDAINEICDSLLIVRLEK